ncbi:MAG TPA: hypothetical protein VK145_01210 [Candidatus Nanoarchaeia archaeon]|nr:hypothetical protein [Candidatus Nanoarchaeia archaeon]
MKKPLIGFIGQGWIGKNYSDDFEKRGYKVVRYALEAPYNANKEKLKDCPIVFIAVPTPTTPNGFDYSIVANALSNLAPGTTAVIKSTLAPRTVAALQAQYPKLYVMHSPEFLSRGTAKYDAAHPIENIVGIPKNTKAYKDRAQAVIKVLPKAPAKIVSAETAEFFKYVHNTSLFARSIYMNILFDLSVKLGVKWADIKELIIKDPMIAFQDPVVAKWHIEPSPKSGRGVGGDCHIKDYETFTRLYKELVGDPVGMALINAMKEKNISLLLESGKDLDLLKGVYGEEIVSKSPKSNT